MIEILAGTRIDPHEVARADRFSDKVYGNDLRWVENFSTSQSRHDSLLRMTELLQKSLPKLHIFPARAFDIGNSQPKKRTIEIDCNPCYEPVVIDFTVVR